MNLAAKAFEGVGEVMKNVMCPCEVNVFFI